MNRNNETPANGKASVDAADLAPMTVQLPADPLPLEQRPEQGLERESSTGAGQEPDPALASDDDLAGKQQAKEYGGPKGLEPTRYGDWERNGRCYDF